MKKHMISYLSGTLIVKKDKFIILDVNGVGYKVFLSQKTLFKIPDIGTELKVFCWLDVRETSLNLYGFLSESELELFEIAGTISGIGPKIALEVAALGSLEKIKDKVMKHDESVFDGVPGLGTKKRMALMMALSGRLVNISQQQQRANKSITTDEAEEALVNLGFTRPDAKSALQNISKDVPTEDRVKEALKLLGRA